MLEVALRSSAILALAWLLTRLLPRASAATRHLVWHSAIVAVLLVPLAAPLAPRFFAVPAIPLELASMIDAKPEVQRGAHAARAVATAAMGVPIDQAFDAALALRLAWSLGAMSCTAWFAAGWWTARRLHRRSRPAPAPWQLDVEALAARLHLRSPVGVRISHGIDGPLVVGLLGGTILLPASAAAWDADRRRSVLLHELAHVRRRDLATHALAQLACAAYWFNPLAWSALRHLRAERERACDDEVLHCGMAPSAYAGHLLEIARELRPRFRPTAALAMSRPAELEGRLLAVLAIDRPRTPSALSRWAVVVVFLLATGAASGANTAEERKRPSAAASSSSPRPALVQEERSQADRAAIADDLQRAAATLQTSPDVQARETAALRLAASGEPASLGALEAALSDPSQDVREKAAFGLGMLSTSEVIPGLLDALDDPDSQVREKAAIGLAFRRDDRVTEALIAAAHDPDAQVREKVAIALGASGDRRAVAAIEALMGDSDAQVREKAAGAAAMILLDSSPDPAAAHTLRRGLRGTVGALLHLARDW